MTSCKKILATSVLALSPVMTQAAHWSPHIGADLVGWGLVPMQVLTTSNGSINDGAATDFFDKNPFPRINRAGNFYVGTRINGYFGVDVGYEQSALQERSVVFVGGEQIFAVPEDPNNAARVQMRLITYNFSMNFYWEAVERLELIFMMGVAYLNPEAKVFHFTYDDGTWVQYRNESRVKYSGRFGFAAQYNPIPCFGIKGMINWDQTRRIGFLGYDENNNQYYLYPYGKSTTYSIGVVYSFNNPRRSPHRIGLTMTDKKY